MENNKLSFFTALLNDTDSSLSTLNYALELIRAKEYDSKIMSLFFDGLIKRFENLFVKVTSLLRFALSKEGIETISPRQVVQESFRLKWINDIDFWLIALDAKYSTLNKTSDISHNEYLNIISQFSTEAAAILELHKKLNT